MRAAIQAYGFTDATLETGATFVAAKIGQPLDRVLFTKGRAHVEARVVKMPGSDHDPVFVNAVLL